MVTGYTVANDLIGVLINRSSSNEEMILLPGNTTMALPRKYTFELGSVNFWEDEQYYLYSNTTSNIVEDLWVSEPLAEINVFFLADDPSSTSGGGIGQDDYLVRIRGFWQGYIEEGEIAGPAWKQGKLLLHEIGHLQSLIHTLTNPGGCQQINDQCSDTPSYNECLAAGVINPCENWCNGATSTNNVMDYNCHAAATPEQLGRIHYDLINNLFDFVKKDYCVKNYNDQFIISSGQNITIEAAKLINKDIIIEDGGKLTVTCFLHLAENVKIVVEQGGEFILDGGILSNVCDEFWKGIYVEGSTNGQGSPNYAGKAIFKNGAIVENARSGVNNFLENANGQVDYSTTGGRILAFGGATFQNNNRDVQFVKYQNMNNSGNPIADYSFFRECNFTINDDYLGGGVIENVTLYACEGVGFYGCNFSDERTGIPLPYNKRTGIYSSSSSIKVLDYCPGQNCTSGTPTTFTNMNYGVYISGKGSPLFNSEVKDSEFKTCWRGVYLIGNSYTEIWLNKFEVTPYLNSNGAEDRSPVGIYLHKKVSDYHIEGNEFYPEENSVAIPPGYAIGIVANTQSGNNEQVYRNEFTHLTVGFESIGKNRYDAGLINNGLRVKCNDFVKDGSDIFMTPGNIVYPQYGIARDQGFVGGDLAFNTFVADPGVRNIDNEIYNGTGIINYRYSIGVPEEFPSMVFDLGSNVYLFDENPPIGEKCTNEVEVIDIGIGIGGRNDARAAKEQKELEMLQVLDGGNTDGLSTDVALTDNTEAWEQYIALMSKSGYISETVMKQMIENENGFNIAMTRNVLVANKHSAKSKDISDALDARVAPLPEYMREQIKLGLGEMSPKDFLQLRKDQHKFDQDKAVRQVYHALLKDSIPTDSISTFIEILSGNDDIRYDYKLVNLYDEIGQGYLADALLEVMSNYDLDEVKEQELVRFADFRQLKNDWQYSGKDEMNLEESDIEILETYAMEDDLVGVEAINLLILNNAMIVEEPVYFPNENKSLERTKPKSTIIDDSVEKGSLVVYPNPARNYFMLEYNIDKIFSNAELRLIDGQGKVLHTIQLINDQDQVVIDISQKEMFKAGIYQCEIMVDGNAYLSTSVVIE